MKYTDIKPLLFAFGMVLSSFAVSGQKLKLNSQEFELRNVTGSIIEFQGKKVLK